MKIPGLKGIAGLLALVLFPLPAFATPPVDRMSAHLENVRDNLIDLRRELHRHPELSGQEERTARLIAERLAKLGFTVTTGVGGHGVVATLRGGKPGGVVGFRADMDATATTMPDPIEEIASTVPGVRHICGHDVHTAVGVGVAEALAALREELPGTVKLLFQPAEENATGARAMVADGALDEPTPEAIFTIHTYPLPVGLIGAVEGVTLVGRDWARVRITGEGDREAAAQMVARELSSATTLALPETAEELAVMSLPTEEFTLVQVLESGPDGVLAQVTVRSDASREPARREIERRLSTLEPEGLSLALEYRPRMVAGVYSDPDLVRASYEPIRAALGEQGLMVNAPPAPPLFSEDFGSLLVDIPGAMFWLGVANPAKGISGMPHTPDHVVDEAAIEVGAKAMAAVVWDFLESSGG